MEVIQDMAISEKELKLLMNFIKDDLTEAKEIKEEEKKNSKIDRVLEHIQQYLEDQHKADACHITTIVKRKTD